MLNIQVDETVVRELYLDELKRHIEKLDKELTFWDTTELKKQTCMSWNTIQEKFFFDPRFPKRKIGGKWYFHAQQTKEFLTEWFKEQES